MPARNLLNIHVRRQALDLSQAQLAARADCSEGMVRLLESGWRPKGESEVMGRILFTLDEMEAGVWTR